MLFENLSLLESFKYEWEPLESIYVQSYEQLIEKRYKMTTNERDGGRERISENNIFFSNQDQS